MICTNPLSSLSTVDCGVAQGKKLISLKGMEQAERSCDNPVAEHCAIFNSHADKAASLLHRMFS